MRFLFLLPVLSDSYYQKRIRRLTKLGVVSEIFGFERKHYEGKPWTQKTTSLGHINHGRYFQRIATLFKSVFHVRKAIRNHDVIYCFSLDTLFISWLATLFQPKKIKIVHDVADIRNILVKRSFASVFLRALERFLMKQVSVFVVTSPAFIEGYFHEIQKVDHNFLVIENKVEADLLPQPQTSPPTDIRKKGYITIGYFGMLRCEQSLRFLNTLLQNSHGSIRLNLRGIFLGTEFFKEDFKNLKYATYEGTFVYPDDLEQMYSSVDLVWAAHMHGETNTKWSMSNRFYQACYFKRPLIAQMGTQDAKKVERYKIGCVIDLRDISKSLDDIESIRENEIKLWKRNIQHIPQEIYTFTDEHELLLEKIKSTEIP